MSDNIRGQSLAFHHSTIQLSNGSVKKFIEPEYPFSSPEREALIGDILEFRRQLQVAGVPVAKDYNLSIVDGIIVEETVNCGMDGFKALKADPSSTGKKVLGLIVRALRPIF